jgi:hypothetical protein
MHGLCGLSPLTVLWDAMRGAPGGVGELEIEAQEGGPYRVRAWPGFRTGYGISRGPAEVPRRLWISDRSMFVAVTATRPHYGGVRLWFICPRSDCARRCRVLYRPRRTNARALACRRCYKLAYASQRIGRMARVNRSADRADALVARLVPKPGTPNVFLKPKWMRWRTFERITREAEQVCSAWQSALDQQVAGADKQCAAEVKRMVQREARRQMRRLAGARQPVSL